VFMHARLNLATSGVTCLTSTAPESLRRGLTVLTGTVAPRLLTFGGGVGRLLLVGLRAFIVARSVTLVSRCLLWALHID
jgi:hypothetical protein